MWGAALRAGAGAGQGAGRLTLDAGLLDWTVSWFGSILEPLFGWGIWQRGQSDVDTLSLLFLSFYEHARTAVSAYS